MSSAGIIGKMVRDYLVGTGIPGVSSARGIVNGVPGFSIECHYKVGGSRSATFWLREAAAKGGIPVVVVQSGATEAEGLVVNIALEDFAPMLRLWLESQGHSMERRSARVAAKHRRGRWTD